MTIGGSLFGELQVTMAEKIANSQMWSFSQGENHFVWANNEPSRMLHTLTAQVLGASQFEEPRGSQEEPVSSKPFVGLKMGDSHR